MKTLPGIREGLEERSWAEARAYVRIVAGAIAAMAGQVQEASTALAALTR